MKKAPKQNRKRSVNISKLQFRCNSGKVRFRDHQEAVASLQRIKRSAVVEIQEQGWTNRNEVRSYQCGSCKGWHITSSETWSNQNRKVA